MSADEGGEKTHEPSARKLEQARLKGDVARSVDLSTTASYAGMTLALFSLGAVVLTGVGQTGMVMLDQSDRLSTLVFEGSSGPVGGMLIQVIWGLAPLFIIPAAAVLLILFAQGGLIFSGNKLSPKWSRISPLSMARQKFGPEGLFEFAKSALKLIVMAVVLAVFLVNRLDVVLGALYLPPTMSTALLSRLLIEFLFQVVLVSTVIGGADYFWQRSQHLKRNRMSRQEVQDENKDQEGDPHTKAQRRQKGYDLATNQMLGDVAKADVVIVNPTHYAVALKWDRRSRRPPVCVAKGVDEIAARIRERAAEAGVPMHRDPPSARAIFAAVEIGHDIQPDHYRAVAASIRFAEAMRRKARAKGWGK
jgi:flagellar biosynthetic protein FlhB